LPAAAVAGCQQLADVVTKAARAIDEQAPTAGVLRELVDSIRLHADIAAGSASPEAAARRRGNVEALLRTLERHDTHAGTGAHALANLVQLLTLRSDADEDHGNVVTLTTVHGAKGLEFDTVFVAGVEEGLIPHARTLDAKATDVNPQDIEEERRLFYVAITRARRRLFLTRAQYRSLRGRPVRRAPSRFLGDVPPKLLVKREVRAPSAPSTKAMLDGVAGLLAALEDS
jgi:DNA helicase-2/ATP-dependent DNA helicase PcrA